MCFKEGTDFKKDTLRSNFNLDCNLTSVCEDSLNLTYREHGVQSHAQLLEVEDVLAEVEELVTHDYIHQVELQDCQNQTQELDPEQLEGTAIEPSGVGDKEVS